MTVDVRLLGVRIGMVADLHAEMVSPSRRGVEYGIREFVNVKTVWIA